MFDSMKEVYLCVKDDSSLNSLSKFNCKKFDTYEEADTYYKNKYNHNLNLSTMIPMCKFTPKCLQEKILNYKLSKIFIQSKLE